MNENINEKMNENMNEIMKGNMNELWHMTCLIPITYMTHAHTSHDSWMHAHT